jgi:fluoride exporter
MARLLWRSGSPGRDEEFNNICGADRNKWNVDKYLIIGLGAFLGANARYLLGTWAAQKWGAAFPYGTLIINVSGSLALGVFLAATTGRLAIDPRWRLFLAIGFLGAYTTFSTYTYESLQLLLNGDWQRGLLNIAGSNLLGLLGAVVGIGLGRRL